jgi:hypothetical protein
VFALPASSRRATASREEPARSPDRAAATTRSRIRSCEALKRRSSRASTTYPAGGRNAETRVAYARWIARIRVPRAAMPLAVAGRGSAARRRSRFAHARDMRLIQRRSGGCRPSSGSPALACRRSSLTVEMLAWGDFGPWSKPFARRALKNTIASAATVRIRMNRTTASNPFIGTSPPGAITLPWIYRRARTNKAAHWTASRSRAFAPRAQPSVGASRFSCSEERLGQVLRCHRPVASTRALSPGSSGSTLAADDEVDSSAVPQASAGARSLSNHSAARLCGARVPNPSE